MENKNIVLNIDKKIMNLARLAISRWGKETQIVMLFEEMAELQKELCKYLRMDNTKKPLTEYKLKEKISNEMADVLMMLFQMLYVFDNTNDVSKCLEQKYQRTIDRIRGK